MTSGPDARATLATPGEDSAAADDSELGHAVGEAVAAYAKDDDQMGDAGSASIHSNGHSSASHRRKHR